MTASSSSRLRAQSSTGSRMRRREGSRRSAPTWSPGRRCAVIAKELGLGERLAEYAGAVAPDELQRISRSRNVLAAVLEAAMAALYLEHGFETIEPAIVAAFSEKIEYARSSHVDYKTELQEALGALGSPGALHGARGRRAARTTAASSVRPMSPACSSASAGDRRRRPPSRRLPGRRSTRSASRRIRSSPLALAVLGVLRAAVHRPRVVIAVDDLQWMDTPSLRALTSIPSARERTRWGSWRRCARASSSS